MGFGKDYLSSPEWLDSVEGRIKRYSYARKHHYIGEAIEISDEEFTLLEDFIKIHIDLIRECRDKGFDTSIAVYVIGSGDRIKLRDLVENHFYGSGIGPSGEYFRKLAVSRVYRSSLEGDNSSDFSEYEGPDFSEEEYLSILREDPFFLEDLEKRQIGYDYLKSQLELNSKK